jgi:glycosyltransferase involved in cell wall biosynthesis
MRILALTSSYPRFEGDPTAPFIESITRGVAALGHNTDLVLPENSRWAHPERERGLRFHPCRYSPRASWTPWGFSESLERGVRIRRRLYVVAPVVGVSMTRCCINLAKRVPFDLVHAHWVIPNGPLGAHVAQRCGLPLVVSLHGSDVSVAQRSAWLGRAARWSFERSSAVTAPSEDLLQRARSLGAKGTLELIPYGGDTETFEVNPRDAVAMRSTLGLTESDVAVMGIGRFVYWKGFDDLVDAIARARESAPSVRLILVGDGDLREDLERRVSRNGLGGLVTFAGMAPRDDVPTYLAAADVVVVPSVHYDGYVDGLPNVALEAMAAARPVIATRVGGLPQVIRDGENGLLVDERDPTALANAIVRLAKDAKLRRTMGELGSALIDSSFNWEIASHRFVDLYERVMRSGGHSC